MMVTIVHGNTVCYANENPTLLQLSMEEAYCIISYGRTLLTLSLLLLCNSKQTNKWQYCLHFVKALMSNEREEKVVEYFDQWEESAAVHSSLCLSDLSVT